MRGLVEVSEGGRLCDAMTTDIDRSTLRRLTVSALFAPSGRTGSGRGAVGGAGRPRWLLALAAFAVTCLVACEGPGKAPCRAVAPAQELVFYDWDGDVPDTILKWFARERGVKVHRLLYESQEEAMASIRSGKSYDVVVMESRNLPALLREGLLAEIDYRNVPNHKNIQANFRDLMSDPGNRHNVPFSFGTTGLIVRSDLVAAPVHRWADLWDPRYRGKVGAWVGVPRDLFALTLKSMGQSANSEDPQLVEAALKRLLDLAPQLIALEDYDTASSAQVMASGAAVISMGYSSDLRPGREKNPAITYVMPEEGALLWNDSLVVPANSPNRDLAEAFLDFMLRPDVSARYVQETGYATPNDAALPLLPAEVRGDRAIYPPEEALTKAEPILPLSERGASLYQEAERRFLAAVKRRQK
jgi:spermidine/putrescine transport system substrate-binding protein